jgi:hypothetical protein
MVQNEERSTQRKGAKHHHGVEMPQRGTNFTISVAKKRTKKLPQWTEATLYGMHRPRRDSPQTHGTLQTISFLVALNLFEGCGGISDRLKPLPMLTDKDNY